MMKSALCALLLLASPAFATIMQQRSNFKWTCSGTVTGGMLQCQQNFTTTGPNDLIAVWTTWQSSVTLTATVSDTLPNTQYISAVGPTQQPTQASGVPANAQIFYLRSTGPVGGADTVTVTLTGLSGTSVPSFGMVMAEYSGLDTVAPAGGPPIRCANLNNIWMRGAPLFRVLCGRVGGENALGPILAALPNARSTSQTVKARNPCYTRPQDVI